jgi:hypothetical protein
MQTLQSEKKWTWAMMGDVDEFLTLNHPSRVTHTNRKANATLWEGTPKFTHGNTTTSVAQLLSIFQQNNHSLYERICVGIPRLLFGPHEKEKSDEYINQEMQQLPKGFEEEALMTYRYFYRAPLGHKAGGFPKSFIDLSRFTPEDYDQLHKINPHKPVKKLCHARAYYASLDSYAFMINHYVGSEEIWSFRNDSRRSMKTFQEYQQISTIIDQAAVGWIPGFVEKVGMKTAKALLVGAGEVWHPSHDIAI